MWVIMETNISIMLLMMLMMSIRQKMVFLEAEISCIVTDVDAD